MNKEIGLSSKSTARETVEASFFFLYTSNYIINTRDTIYKKSESWSGIASLAVGDLGYLRSRK